MKETLLSILVGLITSFCYDLLKTLHKKTKDYSSNNVVISPTEINALKFQFCSCMIIGILFLYIAGTISATDSAFKLLLMLLPATSFFFSFSAFFDTVKMLNNIANNSEKKNRNHNNQ